MKSNKENLKHSLFYNFRYNRSERNRIKKLLSKGDCEFLDQTSLCYWDIPDNLITKVYGI